MNKAIIFIIVLIATSAYATIYVNETPNGGIEYTDTPTSNSSKVEVPAVNSISTPKPDVPPAAATTTTATGETAGEAAEATSTASAYKTFDLVSPANEASIQNQAVIPVEMKVEPNMLPGDKIQLMLDNAPAGTPTSTTYQELANVERGTHTLYAVIVNNKNQVIKKSSSVTIYVHRNSIVPTPNVQRAN